MFQCERVHEAWLLYGRRRSYCGNEGRIAVKTIRSIVCLLDRSLRSQKKISILEYIPSEIASDKMETELSAAILHVIFLQFVEKLVLVDSARSRFIPKAYLAYLLNLR